MHHIPLSPAPETNLDKSDTSSAVGAPSDTPAETPPSTPSEDNNSSGNTDAVTNSLLPETPLLDTTLPEGTENEGSEITEAPDTLTYSET